MRVLCANRKARSAPQDGTTNRKAQSAPQDSTTKGSRLKTYQRQRTAPQEKEDERSITKGSRLKTYQRQRTAPQEKEDERRSSPESQDSDAQETSSAPNQTLNSFLQGLDDFSPITRYRFKRAIEQCLNTTPSPRSAAYHYYGAEDEDYEDEEGYVPEWNVQEMGGSADEADERAITPQFGGPANEADEPQERFCTPPFDNVADEWRTFHSSPRLLPIPSLSPPTPMPGRSLSPPRASLPTADPLPEGEFSQREDQRRFWFF